jgi:hypothetical protein
MEMTLPTKENIQYWKQEIEITKSSSYPHSTGFGYYRCISGRERENGGGGTFTDLVPLPTQLSLNLMENLYVKQQQEESSFLDNGEEQFVIDDPAPYVDLPPCLQYSYFYAPTDVPPSTPLLSSPPCTPPHQQRRNKKLPLPMMAESPVSVDFSEELSNTPSTIPVPAAATVRIQEEFQQPAVVATENLPKKSISFFISFRSKLQTRVEELLFEKCQLVDEDLKSTTFYDISQIIEAIVKFVYQEDKKTLGNGVSFVPKVLCGLGFSKRLKRTYDQHGVRRSINEWNFPLNKLTGLLN